MKKWIVLLLCITFVLSSVTFPAMAAYSLDELFPANQRLTPYSTDSQRSPEQVHKCLDNDVSSSFPVTYRPGDLNDDKPELVFRFRNVTMNELWIRIGNYRSDTHYYQKYGVPTLLDIVYVTASGTTHYKCNMIDQYDPSTVSSTWKCGYQKVNIPATAGVNEIRIYFEEVRLGSATANETVRYANIGDIVFVGATDPHYVPPTAAPTAIPTAVPVPVYTPVPVTQPPYGEPVNVVLDRSLTGYAGPGVFYENLGAFLNAGYTVTALSRAYDEVLSRWYVQIEFWNNSNTVMRAYVDAGSLSQLNINLLKVEGPIRTGVTVTGNCNAYRGPGATYGYYNMAIPYNTVTDVYAEENGFSQIEVYNNATYKLARVWVPSSMLR